MAPLNPEAPPPPKTVQTRMATHRRFIEVVALGTTLSIALLATRPDQPIFAIVVALGYLAGALIEAIVMGVK